MSLSVRFEARMALGMSAAELGIAGGDDGDIAAADIATATLAGGTEILVYVDISGKGTAFTLTTTAPVSLREILGKVIGWFGYALPELSPPWDSIWDAVGGVTFTPSLTILPGESLARVQGGLLLEKPVDIGPAVLGISFNGFVVDIGGGGKGSGSFDFGADVTILEQRRVLEYPFPTPVPDDPLFKLNYLGFGQRFAVSAGTGITTVADAIKAMRDNLKPVEGDDITGLLNFYDPDAGWLIGVDLAVAKLFTLQAVFSDPNMYGLRIGIDKAPLAGLSFEIVYKKISDDIGLYYLDFTLPTAYRQIDLGSLSITLPSIAIWIYTNGDFKLSIGWPLGDRSITVQVFPFIGRAGFYIAKLSSATSTDMPTDHDYNPIVAFGIALSLGVGREFNKGILKASATLSLYGVFEGRLAWIADGGTAGNATPDYFWFRGTFGITGVLQGVVDFGIVKASVTISLGASVTATFETNRKTLIQLNAYVSVDISVEIGGFKIFGHRISITISFSFHTDISMSFEIDNGSSSRMLAARSERMAGLLWSGLAASAIAAPNDIISLPLLFTPQLSHADGTPCFIAALTIGTGTDGSSPFELMVNALAKELLATVAGAAMPNGGMITSTEIESLGDMLRTERHSVRDGAGSVNDAYQQRIDFLTKYFTFTVESQPPAAADAGSQSAVAFPLFAELFVNVAGECGGKSWCLSFQDHNAKPDSYAAGLSDYFNEMAIAFAKPDAAPTLRAAAPEDASMAKILFVDYFDLISGELQGQIQSAAEGSAGLLIGDALASIDYGMIAGKVSRFMLNGLRLPEEIPSDPSMWPGLPLSPLYRMTGQQFPICVDDNPYTISLDLACKGHEGVAPEWLMLGTGDLAPLFTIDDADGRAALQAFAGLVPNGDIPTRSIVPPILPAAKNFSLKNLIPLSRPDTVPGNPFQIIALEGPLMAAVTGDSLRTTLGFIPGNSDQGTPLPFAPGLRIDLAVSRVAARSAGNVDAEGKSIAYQPHIYQIGGTDEASRNLLRMLLDDGAVSGIQSLELLYPAAGGGMISRSAGPGVGLVKTNLSTSSNPQGSAMLMSLADADNAADPVYAKLSAPADFLTLVWECSIVNSGGFYLYYEAVDGADLPESIFNGGQSAPFSILIQFPPGGDAIRPFQNVAVVAAPADSGADGIYVATTPDVMDYEPVVPAGCIGITLQRNNPKFGGGAPQADLDNLFNLVQCRIVGSDAFDESMWGLPTGPADPTTSREEFDLRRLRALTAPEPEFWNYQQTLAFYRFAKRPAGAPPNRYLGVGSSITLEFAVLDLYGNTAPSSPPATLTVPQIMYYDALLPITGWPGVGAQYTVAGEPSAGVIIGIDFDPSGIIGMPGAQTAERAADALVAYNLIYDQITDPNVAAAFSSTLLPGSSVAIATGPASELALFVEKIRAELRGVMNGVASGGIITTSLAFPIADADLPKESIFSLAVTITLSRTKYVDTENPAAGSVTMTIPPLITSTSAPANGTAAPDNDPSANSLEVFAVAFEGAFNGAFRLAVGAVDGAADGAGSPREMRGALQTGNTSLWVVRINPNDGIRIARADAQSPLYYAPPPAHTSLQSGTVIVRSYKAQWSGGDDDFTPVSMTFANIDVELWMRDFLAAFDAFLDPSLALPAADLSPDVYARLMAHKEKIASDIATSLVTVFADQTAPEEAVGAAVAAFYQKLLIRLSSAYEVNTVVQIPVNVAVPDSGVPLPPSGLYGTMTIGAGGAPVADVPPKPNATFTTAKVPLVTGEQYITTLFTSSQPTANSDFDAVLGYRIGFVEYDIESGDGGGYAGSSWLKFVLDSGVAAEAGLTVSLGDVDIPIPLRIYPISPTLMAHSAFPSHPGADDLADALKWSYQVTYQQQRIGQDLIHMVVTYNGGADEPDAVVLAAAIAPGAARPLPGNRFEGLARFVVEYPAVSSHFDQIRDRGDRNVALAAIGRFEELVMGIAETGTMLRASLIAPPTPVIDEYAFRPEDEGRTIVATRLKRIGVAGDLWSPWPAIGGFTFAQDPQSPDRGEYSTSSPDSSLSDPGSGDVTRVLTFADNDIGTLQLATTNLWIERNATLVSGMRTNPLFIFRTPDISFANGIKPFNELLEPITFPTGGSLTLSLTAAFAMINKAIGNQNLRLRMEMSYRYDMAVSGDMSLPVTVPLLLIPDCGLSEPDIYINGVVAQLVTWYTQIRPETRNGTLVMGMTISSGNDQGERIPLLEIDQLLMAIVSTDDWWK